MNDTIDIRPSWKASIEIIIAALEHGTPAGKQMARDELRELGRKLDAQQPALFTAALGDPLRHVEPPATAELEAAADPFGPGAIFYSSWGHEQTNVDFYRVEKRAGDWLTLQKLEAAETSDDTEDRPATMTGRVVPADPPAPIGEPFRRKLHAEAGHAWVKIESYAYAYPWDGTPKRVSHYA